MKTDQNFMWWRARMLGGRTNHWGRVSLRMGPRDFSPRSTDGLGFDWPIAYEDVAPWYDKVDQLIGVYGSKEGLVNDPDSDFFQPPPKPRAYELLLQRGGKKLGIPVIASRMAILTQAAAGPLGLLLRDPLRTRLRDQGEFPIDHRAHPARAGDGQSRHHHRRDGARGDARRGRAARPACISSTSSTGREEHARARAVVLGASACETARILLNYAARAFPAGARQFHRPPRPLAHRLHRLEPERAHPRAGKHAAAQ